MTGDVEHIVNSANNPEITIFIPARSIAGKIHSLKFAPVLFFIPFFVAPNGPKHGRPRFSDNEFSSHIRGDLFALVVHYGSINSKERQRCATRLGWSRPWQRCDHD